MKITLRAARVNAGLTIVEASNRLNVNKETLRSYEIGKTIPRVDFIKSASELYKIPETNIFFEN